MTKDTKAEPKTEDTPKVAQPAYFLPGTGTTVAADSAEAAAKLVETNEGKE